MEREKKIDPCLHHRIMAIVSQLASSMFMSGISQIAEDLNTSEEAVIATTTNFVISLGIGP